MMLVLQRTPCCSQLDGKSERRLLRRPLHLPGVAGVAVTAVLPVQGCALPF